MDIKKSRSFKPPKPFDRHQNFKTYRPWGKTKWVKAHWRWNNDTNKWEWILGQWNK